MKRFRWSGVLLAAGLTALGLAAHARPAAAAEDAWKFLEGLRGKGYFDTALDYLDQIAASPQCPADLKEALDYEAGMTLVAESRVTRAVQMREQLLDQAAARFKKFVAEHAQHRLAGAANSELANVLVERGKSRMEQAARGNKPADEKQKLTLEARGLFQEAQKVFEAAEKVAYDKAKPYEGKKLDPTKDAAAIEERDQARRDFVQSRLYLAGVVYEIAKTYQPADKEYKDLLNASAAKYQDLYDKYGERVGGLYARMWEGRIYKELGENDKAIAVFKEMLTLPADDPAFRPLRNPSLALLVESYTATKKFTEAVDEVKKWQSTARADEESSEDGLKIHYMAGVACLEYAKVLEKDNPAAAKDNRIAARRHFEFVQKFEGEYQRQAKEQFANLSGEKPDTSKPPKDYAEAKDRADFAWGQLVLAVERLQQPNLAKADQEKATAAMNAARDDAIKNYRYAMELRTNEPVDELNLIRFRMTYLYWAAQQYYDAAVMGEFLARRYPGAAGAQKGAEIAVKAYRLLFTQAFKQDQDTDFETAHMAAVAGYITTRWAGQPEADEAWMMLIDTAVDRRDMAKAVEYLKNIPENSPRRGEAELRVGQSLWAAYVQAANKEQDRPSQEVLDALVKQAQDTLSVGITRMRKAVDEGGPISYTLVYSVLVLAQTYINRGQSEQAVALLDDPKIGAMTLVKAKNPVVNTSPKFPEETYKAALRAYVGAQQFEKAEEARLALEQSVTASGDAEANRRLTLIYISLGRELEEQLGRLRKEGKKEEMTKVLRGFTTFLKSIKDRPEGVDYRALNWVAETFSGLASGLDPGGPGVPDEAKQYYVDAAATYVRLIKLCEEKKDFGPPGAAPNLRVRLAVTLRGMGDYENAMKFLTAILKDREKRIDVQIEAAQTYEDWAAEPGKAGYYEYAIRGAQVDGQYIVWGWGGIAKRVAPFGEKYMDTFHQARYHLALCRFRLAMTQSGNQKVDTLRMAELDITRIYQLYPTMGGPESYAKYDTLLKTIQKLLGNRNATGLQGLQKVSAGGPAAKPAATPAAKPGATPATKPAAAAPKPAAQPAPASRTSTTR